MITVSKMTEGHQVIIKGRVDAITAADIDQETNQLIGENTPKLWVDASHITYISSAGLGLFLRLAKQADQWDECVQIADMPQALRAIFEVSGIDHYFEFV